MWRSLDGLDNPKGVGWCSNGFLGGVMQLIPRPQHNGNGHPWHREQEQKHFDSAETPEFEADRGEPAQAVPRLELASTYGRSRLGQTMPWTISVEDFDPSERVTLFIDGSNLFYAAMHLNLEIDYFKLLGHLVNGRKLVRAYFYTGVDRANDKQQGFLLWMRRHGYRVVTKDLVQLPDGSRKANLDVEMAVDMLSMVENYDTAILVSGDGDLAYAVNAIAYKGARVEVVSLQSMTSDSLLNVADAYTDLGAIQQKIAKNHGDRALSLVDFLPDRAK
jgi:uncharacterized LabA/DUF88 family protein